VNAHALTPRFEFNEDAIRAWLTNPDGANLMFPAGWRPDLPDRLRTARIGCLIEDATHGAGIRAPERTKLEFQADELGRFRWLLTSWQSGQPQVAASPWRRIITLSVAGAEGVDAAVAIVRAAVDAGNALLDKLTRLS
jgi:hypothetical protein